MSTKLDTNMTEMKTKPSNEIKQQNDAMKIWFMNNFGNQNATPSLSNVTNEQVTFENQHAPPPPPPLHTSTLLPPPPPSPPSVTHTLQPTIAVVPPTKTHRFGVDVQQTTHQVPPVSPSFPIFTRINTTPKQNDVPLNIVTPTAENNTNNVSGTTTTPTDPPNVKQKTSNNAPTIQNGKLQQQEVQSFFVRNSDTEFYISNGFSSKKETVSRRKI